MVSNTESEHKPKKKSQTLNTNFAYISYNVHLYVYYGLIFSQSWIRVPEAFISHLEEEDSCLASKPVVYKIKQNESVWMEIFYYYMSLKILIYHEYYKPTLYMKYRVGEFNVFLQQHTLKATDIQ